MAHLQHGEQEQSEKRPVVQAQKARAISSSEEFVFGREDRGGKERPVADQKIIPLPQAFRRGSPVPFSTVIESPEDIASIAGREGGK